MVELLARDTRRYAKRQYTWFRSMSDLQWYEVEDGEKLLTAVDGWLSRQHWRG
jgi:tRNA dimethylallyltransferase